MTFVDIPLNLKKFEKNSKELDVLKETLASREAAESLIAEGRYMDALERTVSGLRTLRDFPDFDDTEFRTLLMGLLFDLSEIHFALKDYKQSEKELDVLFKVLDGLIRDDQERFGKYHILAMELSTRILRSRRKTMDLLLKQQMAAGALYEKVNSGVVAATDKLVDSLRNVGQLLASSGDYRAAMKFYAEAIKFSKKRTGRVSRKEIKMTVEMAEIMMRVRQMRPRALRLLNAVLPHAISAETVELEESILALIEIINSDVEHEPKWKAFLHKLTLAARNRMRRSGKNGEESEGAEEKTEAGATEGEAGAEPTEKRENVDDTEHGGEQA